MNYLKYPLFVSVIGLASAIAVNAQTLNGSLVVSDAPVSSTYTASSLTLDTVNYIFEADGDFNTTAPAFSTLTAYSTAITGLSATAATENIPDFFAFSGSGGGFGTAGSTPNNRFNFTLTSLTESSSGSFNGSGTIFDSATSGAFAATPASFTLSFSSAAGAAPGNYSFTFNTVTPTPEPATISIVAAGAVAAWAIRRRKV